MLKDIHGRTKDCEKKLNNNLNKADLLRQELFVRVKCQQIWKLVFDCLTKGYVNFFLATIDPHLTSKESRNTWETTVATDIMTAKLKVIL